MSHLTFTDRIIIEDMLSEYRTQKEIAQYIGKSQQCISKEINRYCVKGNYNARIAQIEADYKLSKRKNNQKVTDEQLLMVCDYLKKGWSPKAICKLLPEITISFSTIYRWVRKGYISCGLLVREGKKTRKRLVKTAYRFCDEDHSIEKRPEIINNRSRIGDWEADTIISSKNTWCLLTLVCRRSRFLIVKLLSNRKADTVENAICQALKHHTKHSITFDNGSEFANYKNIEKRLDISTYFCHPYSSWERGTNENTNGLLRRYFPKKTDFKKYKNRTIQRIVKLLNNRPREVLDFLTSYEKYFSSG